jgi:cytochrome c
VDRRRCSKINQVMVANVGRPLRCAADLCKLRTILQTGGDMQESTTSRARCIHASFGPAKRWLTASLALAGITAAFAQTCYQGPPVALPKVCNTQLPSPTVSCTIPTDMQPGQNAPFYIVQRAANIFSWQAFIGLQWPASKIERGKPNLAAKLDAAGPRVWETWREANEVFRSNGNQPLPPLAWNAPPDIPAACQGADRVLLRTSKVDDTLSDVNQPTGATMTRPLTLKDQRGELTRYEIRMNKMAYDTIIAKGNEWWNGNNQISLNNVTFPNDSIIVKAAWTPIPEGVKWASRFRTINACVCDASATGGPTACAVRKMGLTGFHLMSKTPSAPQWLWSTFEQVDNVPGGSCASPQKGPGPGLNYTYTYNNAKLGNRNANEQTTKLPNQICREIPLPNTNPTCGVATDARDNVVSLNANMQAALRGTPFATYRLINTQWPIPGGGGLAPNTPHTAFTVLPALLGNTTLESFIQGSSSCMGCHAMARTRRHASLDPNDRGFVSSDFTFMLGLATPALAPTPLLTELKASSCEGPSRNDPKCVGLRVTTQTYEDDLTKNSVGAKLHCQSCHLDAGRNPRSSWWKDVVAKYSQPPYIHSPNSIGGIAGRINQCFSKSLNGKNLCTPDANGLCPDNLAMTGLIAYMKWLAEPAQNPLKIPSPATAFPDIGSGTGVATRGQDIYVQKCAFCHRTDGSGRYMDGKYFRPALWGSNSFNAKAGMHSAGDLAPFIYGNMPFGSGGELSRQEAMDLACYIDSQARPPGSGPNNLTSTTGQINCKAPPAEVSGLRVQK